MREIVAVTGAWGGVGRAIAVEFARHGAAVGLIARGRAGLEAAAAEVERHGGRWSVHAADVADFNAVEETATAIEERLGPIDIWVNNAMTTVFSLLDDVEPAEFERATRVTYLGAVWGTKAALARMLPPTEARSSRSAQRSRMRPGQRRQPRPESCGRAQGR